jgi:GTP-binding protein
MSLVIKDVQFVKSSPDVKSCPDTEIPEYAFVGRSNVGKSSLINYLVNENKLAKTSGEPGRTRLINHFLVNNSWHIVDLPGYGYAKVAKTERAKFLKIIHSYLLNRNSLACLFLLIDCRHEPQINDLQFMRWLGEKMVPFVICFTKTDKLSSSQLHKSIKGYKQALLKDWESLPQMFFTSTTHDRGKTEILNFIETTNKSLTHIN